MKVLEPYFDNFSNAVSIDAYCTNIEKIFNKDDETLKKFAFKIFDTTFDKKVS